MAQPPPYGAPPYMQPRPMEFYLTKRNLFGLNAIGLLALWLGGLIAAFTRDPTALNIGRFLAITGGVFAAGSSVGWALGSKRTTDMQNVGLLVWAGLLLAFTASLMGFIGRP